MNMDIHNANSLVLFMRDYDCLGKSVLAEKDRKTKDAQQAEHGRLREQAEAVRLCKQAQFSQQGGPLRNGGNGTLHTGSGKDRATPSARAQPHPEQATPDQVKLNSQLSLLVPTAWKTMLLALRDCGSTHVWSVNTATAQNERRFTGASISRTLWTLRRHDWGGEPLVLYDLTCVLAVLRSGRHFTYQGLIQFFVRSGISFAAPQWESLPRDWTREEVEDRARVLLNRRNSVVRRILMPGFKVTPQLFHLWENTVRRTFRGRNGVRVLRTCLRCGGILWRLALEYGLRPNPDVISNALSEDAFQFRIGESFLFSNLNMWDDDLSVQEEDQILGLYRIARTRDVGAGQAAECMLWPRSNGWKDTMFDIGCWTPRAEEWFMEHKRKYSTADADGFSLLQPETKSGANLAKGDTAARNVWTAARYQAAQFLEQNAEALRCGLHKI
jgi:hypothetical protein